MHQYFVYILASQRNGTLYTGITNNLARRVDEHRSKSYSSFTTKYGVTELVYFEAYQLADEAIRREKDIKAWKRLWKLQLIENNNPDWKDLSSGLLD